MKRIIGWTSRVFDEIELVYSKAGKNEMASKLMEQLEVQALSEAKANCGLLTTDRGNHIHPDQFDRLSDADKETVIKVLARMGMVSIDQDLKTATIVIRLSAKIQSVMACTVFDILNRLEKLDGAINMLIPKWTLELQVPLGGKKGLFQWELLIMRIYPWISVRETSTNEVASDLLPASPAVEDKTMQQPETVRFLPVGGEGCAFKKYAIEFFKQNAVSKAYLAKKVAAGKESYVMAMDCVSQEKDILDRLHQHVSKLFGMVQMEIVPYSAVKKQLSNADIKMFYLSERKPSDRVELFCNGFGFFTSERDAEGVVGTLNIHLGKPYCGYYRLHSDGAVALLLHLRDKYGIDTLELSLREFARRMAAQRLREGITIRSLDQEGEYMWALMEGLPKLLDSLGIYYEDHMYFD